MKVLDQALELAQNRQKDNEIGQISLFDLDQGLDEDLDMPEIAEFEENEILKMEKEYIGVYLTAHPLSYVNELLRRVTTSEIASCLESEEERKVILGGIINSFRQTITKKGDLMASFLLEDLSDSIEVLIFPRLFAETVNLANDQIVIVHGRYHINEDEKKIFAEKVITMDEYLSTSPISATIEKQVGKHNSRRGKLFIKFMNDKNKELLDKVLVVLGTYRGSNPVYFFFQDTEKTFKVSKNYSVRYDSGLEQKLIFIVGKDNIKWQ
jgi:DNA polymerase-3 subunit alpha